MKKPRLGIASCITARAEETFDNDIGRELLKKWCIPDNFIARAFVLLGYCDGEYPQSKSCRDGRVVIVDED